MLLLQEGWLLLEVWLVRHRRLRTVLSGGSKAFCPNTICPLISTNLEFLKFTRTHFLKIASHFLVQDYWPKSICLTSILERMGAITGWKGVEGLHLRERELDPWGGGRLPFRGVALKKGSPAFNGCQLLFGQGGHRLPPSESTLSPRKPSIDDNTTFH